MLSSRLVHIITSLIGCLVKETTCKSEFLRGRKYIERGGGGGGRRMRIMDNWRDVDIYKVWRTIKPKCSTYGALNKIMIFLPCHHGGPTQVTHLKHCVGPP